MYSAVVRLALQRQLTYRTANLSGLVTNLFWGALRAYVLIALFGAREVVEGYDLRAAITYTGFTQAMISYLAGFGWYEVIREVRSGQIGATLTRPLDYFWYWAADDLGRALGQLLSRGVPIMALYAIAFRITLPTSLAQWLAVALSLGLAFVISFAWRFLTNLAAFWSGDAVGVVRLTGGVSLLLAGLMMPLAFFPDWARELLRWLPFASMLNAPAEVYLGVSQDVALLELLAIQLVWAVALVIVARAVLAAGMRRLVIQGG